MREDIAADSAFVRVADARASTAEMCAAARIGDAYNNAMAENFFSTFKSELLARRFHSQAEAQMACSTYIERFYTPLRRHSALRYRSPVVSEQEIPDEMQMTARLGDELAVLMPCEDAVTARRLAEQILEVLRGGNADAAGPSIATSISVALYPNDATDRALLLSYADTDLYRATSAARGTYRFAPSVRGRSIEQRSSASPSS